MIFADEEGLGQFADVQILRQMGVDVAGDLPDPVIFNCCIKDTVDPVQGIKDMSVL